MPNMTITPTRIGGDNKEVYVESLDDRGQMRNFFASDNMATIVLNYMETQHRYYISYDVVSSRLEYDGEITRIRKL